MKAGTKSLAFSFPEIGEFQRGVAEFTQVIDKLAKQVESEKMKVEYYTSPNTHYLLLLPKAGKHSRISLMPFTYYRVLDVGTS